MDRATVEAGRGKWLILFVKNNNNNNNNRRIVLMNK
jgi:hypothetical protein